MCPRNVPAGVTAGDDEGFPAPSVTLERARAQTLSGVACIILSLYSPKLVGSTDNWLVLPLRLSCQAGWYDDIGLEMYVRMRHIQQYGLDSL